MKELKCPNCGSVFSVDEADYASIVNQVKTLEFDAEVESRLKEIMKQNKIQQEADSMKISQKYQEQLNSKEIELSKKENEIVKLQARLDSFNQAKQLELETERAKTNEEIVRLKSIIKQNESNIQVAILEERNKVKDLIQTKENSLIELRSQIDLKQKEATIREASIKEDYERQLKQKQELVDYYKDLKAKLSTKMIGESLEVHCSNEFNRVRTSMYPNAYFDKDNDASHGSKGDFIFRDYIDNIEYISMMFEMKNEMDETATKHKNEDFFAKLDKDRRDKGCEYAILVSLLEPDNDLYNEGIVDVSYRYPKMFVIRPQFFMPLISLLTQASKKSIEYQKELIVARQQSVDVTNFENKLNDFRDKFGYHYQHASAKFNKAIEDIDKAIISLQKMKEDLMSSANYLRLANNDTEALSIKRLTRGNPTMKKMFDDARAAGNDTPSDAD
ncbi:DUF2130 domain-containing protein [Caecibacteroides pullorum]|uniref:DUF2130 domain-containing protein n=1 Tax=Caecibacteroides pullorum TaxID=2725562 RepID=A0AA40ZTB8_9BACT|nr:DUF2130 domain-containing protein [Caecibacteroides pullorum]MBM6857623.1 DUF2130 domain-containing protein [Caecibacteroides pullorum]MBV8058742.1 DUF2130 domain-containing protein [Caecibacteroides pullorum]